MRRPSLLYPAPCTSCHKRHMSPECTAERGDTRCIAGGCQTVGYVQSYPLTTWVARQGKKSFGKPIEPTQCMFLKLCMTFYVRDLDVAEREIDLRTGRWTAIILL